MFLAISGARIPRNAILWPLTLGRTFLQRALVQASVKVTSEGVVNYMKKPWDKIKYMLQTM